MTRRLGGFVRHAAALLPLAIVFVITIVFVLGLVVPMLGWQLLLESP